MNHSFEFLLRPDQATLRKTLLKSCRSNFFVTSLEEEKSSKEVVDAAREWQENLRAFLEKVKECDIAQEECIVLQTEVTYWRKKFYDAQDALTELRAKADDNPKLTEADFFDDEPDDAPGTAVGAEKNAGTDTAARNDEPVTDTVA